MTDYLAINWENNELYGLDAAVDKGGVQIRQCFTLAWPDDIDPDKQTEDAGEWLRDQLKQLKVSSKQVLVTVPREDATVRHMELPETPDSELPDLVRFQASTKSALPIAQLCLDYLPLPSRGGVAGRNVLMATMSKSRVNSIQAIMAAANLDLVSFGVGPIAAAELVARVAAQDSQHTAEASLVLGHHENRLEISVVRDRYLLFTHSSQLGSATGDDQQILAEVSRSFVALQKTSTEIKIGQAWVLGQAEKTQSLVDNLKTRLQVTTIATDDCRVAAIDPLDTNDIRLTADEVPGNRALYAGPVGMLLSKSDARVDTINFINPRKPEVEPDRRKYQALLITAIAILVAGTTCFWWWRHLDELDAQITAQKSRSSDYKEQLDRVAASLEVHDKVQGWVDTHVNWLEQVRKLTATIEDTERHYLKKLTFGPGKSRMLGKISGTGAARSDGDVNQLYYHIHEVERWSALAPNSIPKDSGDTAYPYRFDLDVDLNHQSADESDQNQSGAQGQTKITTSLPPKGGRR